MTRRLRGAVDDSGLPDGRGSVLRRGRVPPTRPRWTGRPAGSSRAPSRSGRASLGPGFKEFFVGNRLHDRRGRQVHRRDDRRVLQEGVRLGGWGCLPRGRAGLERIEKVREAEIVVGDAGLPGQPHARVVDLTHPRFSSCRPTAVEGGRRSPEGPSPARGEAPPRRWAGRTPLYGLVRQHGQVTVEALEPRGPAAGRDPRTRPRGEIGERPARAAPSSSPCGG